ncbi:Proteins of 100 residues with WXG [Saccharopolyspora kobensis]|uniref:Proteins of 100 residues with WXG n=1 Tax=Saccharopolyspora kobensis TaxID=146035 RepID=A0A1H6ED57_9PSEU|nr:WXG100 family type VII secretion target [Saccharopolyspora kobensis]SEG95738.1 Proteins of 100 residues with WXG [Saccharopolyspora kobensis]SFD53672.1 Proteins of 100 residues with WXG [Saccharopolyspora kobensis]
MPTNLEAAMDNSAINMSAGPVDFSAFGKLPFVKDLIGPGDDAGQGEVEAVRVDVASFLGSATSFALDPMSFLIGTGVEFVIDFVAPVRDAIQLVTGDSEALAAGAEAFSGIKGELDALATALTETLDGELAGWDGEAADALRTKMADFIEGVQATGGQANNISQLLQMSGTMMEAAEGVIKGILADFLTWAITTWITATASAGPTLGGSIAAATAVTTAQAGITCARAAQQIQRITRIIGQIMNAITAIKAILDTIRIIESVNQITDPGSGGDGGESVADDGSRALGQQTKDTATERKLVDQFGKGMKEQAEARGYTVDGDDNIWTTGEDGTQTFVNSQGHTDITRETPEAAPPKYTMKDLGMSAFNRTAAGLGSAADQLEKQAEEGGFSDVPADETISGNLNW